MPPSQKYPSTLSQPNTLQRAKEFTDTAMNLDLEDVLREAVTTRKIGQTAADITGRVLALEGDVRSKGIINGAYNDVHMLMKPTLERKGPEAVSDIFNQPGTRLTVQSLAHRTDDRGMRRITQEYAKGGKHLHVTSDGLVPVPGFKIPESYESSRGGCPFARNEKAAYYDKFTDRIVETYVRAHAQGMPHGWLDQINQSLFRR
ncbi:hypothetical protein H7142_00185 [Candidatus Saccharibacteria bacterium]|nr:hypothetical protein [Candidatus Saccharibacteria bacterium]